MLRQTLNFHVEKCHLLLLHAVFHDAYGHVMVDFASNVPNAPSTQPDGSWREEEKARCLFGCSRIYCTNFEGIHLA
jgi:hypothetical protein